MNYVRRAPFPELILAAAALLLSALGAEWYLRRFHPIDATILQLDPRYLYTLIPGARKLYVHRRSNGGDTILVSVNAAGFRGPELAQGKRGKRVVVYGDSFVAAEYSPVPETFVAQLGRRLEAALGVPVEAVNAGVVGYGPDQEALRLEDEIGPLAPDLIVVAIFAQNDFGDLVRNKLFRLGPDGELVENACTLAPALKREFASAESLSHKSMLLRGLWQLLSSPRTIRKERTEFKPHGGWAQLLTDRQREYAEYVIGGNNEVQQVLGDPYDADVSLAPQSDSARYKVSLMEKVLSRIASVADSRRVPVVFVIIPSGFDVFAWEERIDPGAFPEYRPDALTGALVHMAERNGFRYLDLYSPFHAAGADRLYYRYDVHWNAAGQELAAKLTSALVVSKGWMKSP